MQALEPRMKNISIMKPDPYYDNLRLSGLRDSAINPSGGSGYNMRKKVDGMRLDEGTYNTFNNNDFIRERELIRKGMSNNLTLTEAKLPKPVVVTDYDAVQQQPAINMADVDYPMFSDLNDIQKMSVLGDRNLDSYIKKDPVVEKLRDIQLQIHVPLGGKTTKKQLLKMRK